MMERPTAQAGGHPTDGKRWARGAVAGRLVRTAFVAAICGGILLGALAWAAPKGRVLVVLSSAHELELRDGKQYDTGIFLNEFVSPVRALLDAGYEPVFANPDGSPVHWDSRSVVPAFFGGNKDRLEKAQQFVARLDGLQHPRTLASVHAEGVAGYVGVMVPGGHAPLQDLVTNADVGAVLTAFHAAAKPTALICHGPAALLATLPDPAGFKESMVKGDAGAAQKLATGWPYAGYHMTSFSTSEERFVEPRLLHGQIRFYLAEALAQAGGQVEAGPNRRSATVQDRELITGQQPFSDEAFSKLFIAALDRAQLRN